ncbi:hypothetical protein OIDMADRAFT_58770 [Oidiodendron maius Zn]|uniref:Zn(2)-C6 fungal-type domain-containing protein n=1 Tax=Oidiodendron maius (strain Zn) TaxID=913774 RepID=A0A0C3GZ54_OIDMZ|nr:hypothetical protein OIDMADRAFT_58770 [Oidiodendron maius Zn]
MPKILPWKICDPCRDLNIKCYPARNKWPGPKCTPCRDHGRLCSKPRNTHDHPEVNEMMFPLQEKSTTASPSPIAENVEGVQYGNMPETNTPVWGNERLEATRSSPRSWGDLTMPSADGYEGAILNASYSVPTSSRSGASHLDTARSGQMQRHVQRRVHTSQPASLPFQCLTDTQTAPSQSARNTTGALGREGMVARSASSLAAANRMVYRDSLADVTEEDDGFYDQE